MIYPEPEKGGKGKLSRLRDGLDKTMRNLVSMARTVLDFATELRQGVVIAGPGRGRSAYGCGESMSVSCRKIASDFDRLLDTKTYRNLTL